MICCFFLASNSYGTIGLDTPMSVQIKKNDYGIREDSTLDVYPINHSIIKTPRFIDWGTRESGLWSKIVDNRMHHKIGVAKSEDWSKCCSSVKRNTIILLDVNNDIIYKDEFPDFSVKIMFDVN